MSLPTRVDYEGYRIDCAEVPQAQFSLGLGFGWGFRVYRGDDQIPTYALVVKSLLGNVTEHNIRTAFEIGLCKTKELLDSSGFVSPYMCFRWEPDPPEPMPLSQVDCADISPGDLMSPFPKSP